MSDVQGSKTGGKTITFERVWPAALADVWELWTTREGLESWWGPEGFRTEVRALDLRAGGELRYGMIAEGADQVAFMKRAGLPLVTEARLTFTEVSPMRRLAFENVADFIPGVKPYSVHTTLELFEENGAVRTVLTLGAMHDAEWTQRSAMGWESQLGKLAKRLAARNGSTTA